MRSSFALVAASISSLALAQSFFSTTDVPPCAQQCANLLSAQQACPPTSNQPATCFCNSNFLVNLLSAPTNACPQCTAQSDISQLTGWFNQFCKEGGSTTWSPSGASTAPPTASPTAAPAATTTVPTNPDATSARPSGSPTSNTDTNDDSPSYTNPNAGKSWWDLHKGWIAMVIVLIIAFAAIIAGGVWWKKRHTRKRNAAGATLPGAWGPSDQQTARFSSDHVEKYGGSASASPVAGPGIGEITKQKIARSLRRS